MNVDWPTATRISAQFETTCALVRMSPSRVMKKPVVSVDWCASCCFASGPGTEAGLGPGVWLTVPAAP